jgi:hypothetical protein
MSRSIALIRRSSRIAGRLFARGRPNRGAPGVAAAGAVGGVAAGAGAANLADREEISLGVRAGDSFTAIAIRLGKAVSTVAGGGR